MATAFAQLTQEHRDTMQAEDALLDAAIGEGRALTTDEDRQVAEFEARLDDLDTRLEPERKRRALRAREQQALAQQPDLLDVRGIARAGARGESVAARLLADPDFAAWRANMTANGVTRQGSRLESPRVDIGALAPLRVGSATSAGALTVPDQYGLVPFPQRPLTIRSIVTNATTTSDTVEFVRTTSTTNNAALPAEATDVTAGGTGLKPQSDMAFERKSVPVATIAHWIAATRRALADAEQLQSLVESFLLYGLEEVLEDQMIMGDGVGEAFEGAWNVAGHLVQPFVTNVAITTRKARTQVRLTGRATPTAYVMNPADAETIDLLQDNEGRFYYGGPSTTLTPRLWGVPIVESEAVQAGNCILADWRYAVLWDRMQGAIFISDSHADFFIKNLIAIMAELRAAFGILRPQAFCKVDMVA